MYNFKLTLILILTGLICITCSSRLRTTLYLLDNEKQSRKLTIDQTHVYPKTSLNDPYADSKIISGSDRVAVLNISTRYLMRFNDDSLFHFNENWRANLFLTLPLDNITGESFTATGNSFIHLRDYYELPPKDKMFLPQSGSYKLDSLVSDDLFITLNARYQNTSGLPLELNGQIKLKITD